MRPNLGALVLGGAVMAHGVACGPAAGGHGAGATASEALLPPLEVIAPLKPPQPILSVVITAETQTLSTLFDTHAPRVVASERGRSIGAPGRVDYRVERGDLAVEVSAAALRVSTPLRGQVNLCKPFGPFCPEYGRCAPGWEVQAVVPWLSDPSAPPDVKLLVGMTRGCVLSPIGLDVSSIVSQVTQEQTRKVQAQLTSDIKAAHGQAVFAYHQMLSSLSAPSDPDRSNNAGARCVTPTALHYDLQQSDQALTAVLSAHLDISEQPCAARALALPELRREAELKPETTFEHWAEVPLKDIEQHLNASLGAPVTLRSGRTARGNALFMLPARTPKQWFELKASVRDSQLHFAAAPWVGSSRSAKAPPALTPLAPLDVPSARSVAAAARALGQALAEGAAGAVSGARWVVVDGPGAPLQSVRLGPDSVAVVTSVSTPIGLELRPQRHGSGSRFNGCNTAATCSCRSLPAVPGEP